MLSKANENSISKGYITTFSVGPAGKKRFPCGAGELKNLLVFENFCAVSFICLAPWISIVYHGEMY